jgi:uncharacterized membrane protein
MSMNKTDDAVSEYLREVGVRLGGLPLLQRRELLADLEAHIANERAERNVRSEGEVLEILERLGSPEAVAAAAYEEAGPVPFRPAAAPILPIMPIVRPSGRRWWPLAVALAAGVLVLLVVLGLTFVLARSGAALPAEPAPVAPPATVPR